MEPDFDYVYRITPVVRAYDWGMPAESSLVYKLFTNGKHEDKAASKEEMSKPYAELWIGDHDSAPCPVLSCKREGRVPRVMDSSPLAMQRLEPTANDTATVEGSSDKKHITRLSDIYRTMGRKLYGAEGSGPFILFKILSISKPLSLQIHPDPDSAIRMFDQEYPSIVDDQSKPEMCLALCPFRLMCGLRPLSEILYYAQRYPPFAKLLGDELMTVLTSDHVNDESDIYLSLCRHLLLEQKELGLVEDLVEAVKNRQDPDLSEQVLLKLRQVHGIEICVSFAFILNCIELKPGESMFIPHNTMHSYISGNCVELMNNSDNVIRCGLTPKKTDVNGLLELLKAESDSGTSLCQKPHTVCPKKVNAYVTMYQPKHPVCKFTLCSFVVPGKTTVTHRFSQNEKPFMGILFETNDHVDIALSHPLYEGDDGKMDLITLELGECFLLYPNTEMAVKNDGDSHAVLYLAT